jgi:molybdopterin molybdotransferase
VSFLSFKDSMQALEALHVKPAGYESVFVGDALGRVLAEDIVAQNASPEFATSAMDGYAILGADQSKEHIVILGDNPAGSEEQRVVSAGVCIKTFTGSKMPEGADTLIPIENVTVKGSTICIDTPVKTGAHIRLVGESYFAGDVLIEKGTKISFSEIGVMAGLNKVMVKVLKRPRVSIISTGSEILDLGEEARTSSQIRSSNNYTIEALAKSAGANTLQLGVVKDDKDSIVESFENALCSADIVVSTGGVSVGDYDFVKEIIPALDAEVIFHGVRIKPGQHIMLARRENQFIVALPGFAYSATVTALLYVLPLIRRFLGLSSQLPCVEAKLKESFLKKSKKTEFTACNVTLEKGAFMVDFVGKKAGTSAILTNLLHGSALMMTGENDGDLNVGTSVDIILLDRL